MFGFHVLRNAVCGYPFRIVASRPCIYQNSLELYTIQTTSLNPQIWVVCLAEVRGWVEKAVEFPVLEALQTHSGYVRVTTRVILRLQTGEYCAMHEMSEKKWGSSSCCCHSK